MKKMLRNPNQGPGVPGLNPIFFGAVFIAASLFSSESKRERETLRTEYYTFRDPRIHRRQRLVFLSDLHSHSFGEANADLVSRIDELNPDMVLIGGDMMTIHSACYKETDLSVMLELCRVLSERYPVLYAEGNHELKYKNCHPGAYEALCGELSGMGIQVLVNGSVETESCTISAVSLGREFYTPINRFRPSFGHLGLKSKMYSMPEGYLNERLGKPDSDKYQVLMIHSPLYLAESAAWGADLVLSGHFHGGTIRLPYFGGLMTPQYQFFVKECSGLHRIGRSTMLVNRGLGTHTFNIRINDYPEISCIDLLTEDD